jgi:hypothetical protein
MGAMKRFDLDVTGVRAEAPQICALRLARWRRDSPTSWRPGAHVKVRLPDGDEQCYSLIDASGDGSTTARSDLQRSHGRAIDHVVRARQAADMEFLQVGASIVQLDENEAASEAFGPGTASRDGGLGRRVLL